MNSDITAKATNLIIQYFNQLENKIDIIAEKCLTTNSDVELISKINYNRKYYLEIIKQTRESILTNLETLICTWNGKDPLESVVFQKEYLVFLKPVYESDIGKCIGKLIKFDYYLPDQVLSQLLLFFDQTRDEGYFTIDHLNESILHAYLLIREIDPLIDEFESSQESNSISIWRNGQVHESKLSNIYDRLSIDFQFFQIKHISSQTFSKMKNLIELSLTNCGMEYLDQSIFSDIPSLKVLNLSFNQFSILGPSLFSSLSNLEQLILCGCDISSIHKECFSNLLKIKLLDLSKNNLNLIEPTWFLEMPNLEILYLNSNKVESLEEKTFGFLTNLRYLNISKNRIENIQAKVFYGLNSLNEICYDSFFDLKSILGDSFKHVKYHPSQNHVM